MCHWNQAFNGRWIIVWHILFMKTYLILIYGFSDLRLDSKQKRDQMQWTLNHSMNYRINKITKSCFMYASVCTWKNQIHWYQTHDHNQIQKATWVSDYAFPILIIWHAWPYITQYCFCDHWQWRYSKTGFQPFKYPWLRLENLVVV